MDICVKCGKDYTYGYNSKDVENLCCECGVKIYESEAIPSCICGYTGELIISEMKLCYESEGNYHNITKSESILICPECGTLKIDKW